MVKAFPRAKLRRRFGLERGPAGAGWNEPATLEKHSFRCVRTVRTVAGALSSPCSQDNDTIGCGLKGPGGGERTGDGLRRRAFVSRLGVAACRDELSRPSARLGFHGLLQVLQ